MSFVELNIFPGEHYVSWLIRLSSFMAFADFKGFIKSQSISTNGFKTYDVYDRSIFALSDVKTEFDTVVREHSLIPFWQLSVGSNRLFSAPIVEELFKAFSLIDEKTIFNFDMSWKSCPECREFDMDTCGTSYWHVAHQLPSAIRCYKHGVVLQKSRNLVRNLNCGLLPHHVTSWKSAVGKVSPVLSQWNVFLNEMHTLSLEQPIDYVNTKLEILSLLCLEGESVDGNEVRCDELTLQLEDDIETELLEYLFKDYARASKRGKYLVFHGLFLNIRRHYMLRSPIHWILLAYWLRKELFV